MKQIGQIVRLIALAWICCFLTVADAQSPLLNPVSLLVGGLAVGNGNPLPTTSNSDVMPAAVSLNPVTILVGGNPVSGSNPLPVSGGASITNALDNRIVNGAFQINQRAYVSGTALASGAYGHDMWRGGAGGATYTFAQNAADTTIAIAAGTLQQVIQGASISATSLTCSWSGTATARINSGSYAASPITATGLTVGTAATFEANTGTLQDAQCLPGANAATFQSRVVGEELALAQRWYWRWTVSASFSGYVEPLATLAGNQGGNTPGPVVQFPVTMACATPTVDYSDDASLADFYLSLVNGANDGPLTGGTFMPTSTGISIVSMTTASLGTITNPTTLGMVGTGKWIDASCGP